jgi:Protein of unknown function (DUF4011)
LAGTSIRDRLLADRRALLDLGTRNRLINIPLRIKNIRAIEIVDCKSKEVFDLLGQAKRCTFVHTEEDGLTDLLESGQLRLDSRLITQGSERRSDWIVIGDA